MSEQEEILAASRDREVPYSMTPLTACPKGGRHAGNILDRCSRCGSVLTYADFEKKPLATVSNGKLHVIKCVDCGASREVKPQDVWQVKRCRPCQAKKSGKSFKKFLAKVKKEA